MKVLFLTHQGDLAGSTNSIFYLADGLAQRGHQVFVGCRRESLLYQLLKDSTAEAVAMTFRGRLDLDNMKQIRDIVLKEGIDVINAQSSLDRYTSGLSRWIFRLPVALIHTRRQMPKSTGLFLQNWYYTASTSCIVAVSGGVKSALVSLGIPSDHIKVIKNGTPKSKYVLEDQALAVQIRERLGLPGRAVVIGCISRRKNQEQLLEAYANLKSDVWLVFVGIEEDDGLKEIELSPEQRSRVIYTGMVPREQVLYYHQLFTMEVLASTMEGLSQSLLEAMALGIPVIATNAAGNPDLISHGQNGLLFEDGDIMGLADSIERLINDKEIRQSLITQGRKTALEEFEIERVIDRYETLFEEEIEKRDS